MAEMNVSRTSSLFRPDHTQPKCIIQIARGLRGILPLLDLWPAIHLCQIIRIIQHRTGRRKVLPHVVP